MYYNNFNKYVLSLVISLIVTLSTFSKTITSTPYNHVKNQIIFELFDAIKNGKMKKNHIEKARVYYPKSKFLNLLLDEERKNSIQRKVENHILDKKIDKLKSLILRDVRKNGKNEKLDEIVQIVDAFITLNNYFEKRGKISSSSSYFKHILYLEKKTKIFSKFPYFTFFLKKERIIGEKLYIRECLGIIELLKIQSNSLELLRSSHVKTTILAQIEFLKQEILTHKNRIF